jgi:hypothetical protein
MSKRGLLPDPPPLPEVATEEGTHKAAGKGSLPGEHFREQGRVREEVHNMRSPR